MEQQQPLSQMQEFYKGQTLLVTGITGFIGTCLIEKLLRSCSGVEKIYTIIRPKKGATIESRVQKFCEQSVFDSVRKQDPNFMRKLVVLKGDLADTDLGLSPEDRRLLIENVTLIIHNAASVAFYHRISGILKINVLGTKQLLELASECSRLRAFVYVSTAYSQSHLPYTEEKCYPPPADLKIVDDIIAADTITERGMTEEALSPLRNNSTTNYTFTKAITEGIVEQFSRKVSFPCAIFRPSIVFHSVKEPWTGWLTAFSGPTLMYYIYSLGYLHAVPVAGDPIFDVVPVDMTCNALLACLWDLAVVKKPQEKCHVYHYTSGQLNRTSLKVLRAFIEPYILEKPSIKSVWYPSVMFIGDFWTFFTLHCLLHVFPGLLYDLTRFASGKRLLIFPKLQLMVKNVKMLATFVGNEFTFEMKEMLDIWDRQSAADKEIFYSDIRELDWASYGRGSWDSMRANIFRESDEMLPAARRKHFKLKILHYTIRTLFIFTVLYFLYSFICRLFGL